MQLPERLREIRLERNLTQSQLAKLSGVSQSVIGGLETGQRSGSAHMARIASILGVEALWLAEGRGKKNREDYAESDLIEIIKEADEHKIKQFDTGGKMGISGLTLVDQPGIIRSFNVNEEWLSKNVRSHTGYNNLAIVTGFGDSMSPVFNPGDPLLVDRGVTEVKIDAIYFFRIRDEGFIKRLQRIPIGKGMVIRAHSENKQYDPFDITEDMDFQVLAKVIRAWCGKDF